MALNLLRLKQDSLSASRNIPSMSSGNDFVAVGLIQNFYIERQSQIYDSLKFTTVT